MVARQRLANLWCRASGGETFQPDKMAANVADPDSFGHREMTALLNPGKILLVKDK